MKLASIAALALLAAAAPAIAQDESSEPEAPLNTIEILPLTFSPEGLGGPGGERLRAELPEAQFIALGEDHGYAGSPELARALAHDARPHGLRYHVVEIGPLSGAWAAERLAEGGPDRLGAALRARPLAIPFLVMREDAELAADFIGEDGANLWYVDQEFVGSPLIMLDLLAQRAPNQEALSAVEDWRTAERGAFADGNPTAVMLFRATPEDFAELRGHFPGDERAGAIIDALARSAPIYQAYGAGRNFESNATRIALIRELFLAHYAAAPEDAPRVLFKMGGYHMGRGTTPTLQSDLGTLVDGLAAANGLRSLHIAFMPLGGQQRLVRPGGGSVFEIGEASEAGAGELLEAAHADTAPIGAEGYYLVPLAPIRAILENRGIRDLSADARFLLLGFDYLVTTRAARPSTPLVD